MSLFNFKRQNRPPTNPYEKWGRETGSPDTTSPETMSPTLAPPVPTPALQADAFSMTVEDAYNITGLGTVVTGQVASGWVHIGDRVEVHCPTQTIPSVIQKIEMFRKTLDTAQTGDNVALVLKGISQKQVKHGDVITAAQ